MEQFVVEGGNRLDGSLLVKGAKNSMLPIMAASVLNSSEESVVLHNIPNIYDLHVMKNILGALGFEVVYRGDTLQVTPGAEIHHTIPDEFMKEMRSSIFLMGPLLARLGKVKLTYPGGCSIGPRPIDLHLKGLASLGVQVREENGYIEASAEKLLGTDIHLDYPSVGATENLIMAAVLAHGKTIIHNAAKEPEIVDLQNFLNTMGCQVRGAGTEKIRIAGVPAAGGCHYRIIPDRIVAGTYLMAAAITGGQVTLHNIIPSHLDAVVAKLKEAGVEIQGTEDSLTVLNGRLQAVETLRTLPYPGFPTDLQAPMSALLTKARGDSLIVESVFEARFQHMQELIKMKAQVSVKGRNALITGVERLVGAQVNATDLRAGAALVLAALAAEGTSVIQHVWHIDRGYECMEKALGQLGARIQRTSGLDLSP